MEDDPNISKGEYLGNHSLEHTQILNIAQTKLDIYCKWRRPLAKDDIK